MLNSSSFSKIERNSEFFCELSARSSVHTPGVPRINIKKVSKVFSSVTLVVIESKQIKTKKNNMEQHDMECGMNDDEYDEYSSNMIRKNAYLVPHDIPNYSFNFPSPSPAPLTSTFVNRSSSSPLISTHSYHTTTQPHHSTSSSPQSLDEYSPPQAPQAKTKKENQRSTKRDGVRMKQSY